MSSLLFRRRVGLAAVLTAVGALLLALLIPVQSAQASVTHYVSLTGNMTLNDDETWPWSDEHTTAYISSGWLSFTHEKPEKTFIYKKCVGGEVTGQLNVKLQLASDDRVSVQPMLLLYEGTSCEAEGQWVATPYDPPPPNEFVGVGWPWVEGDLDGTQSMEPRVIPLNTSSQWPTIRVTNTAENVPDDYAELSYFQVSHVLTLERARLK